MRQNSLRVVLLVIGVALVAGALIHYLPRAIVPETLRPLDSYVGTEGSVVGAVFGVAVCRAALTRPVPVFWVWLTIAYAFAVAAFEVIAHFTIGRAISLAPIIFGVLSGALLLALLYPQQRRAPAPPQRQEPPTETAESAPGATGGEAENLR
jgi:hypothetical protein